MVAQGSSGEDVHPASPGELGAENLPPAAVPVPGARGSSVLVWREQREGRTVPGRVGAVRAGRAGGGTGGICKAL